MRLTDQPAYYYKHNLNKLTHTNIHLVLFTFLWTQILSVCKIYFINQDVYSSFNSNQNSNYSDKKMTQLLDNLKYENPVLRAYVFWSSILIIKMLLMSFLTGMKRFATKVNLEKFSHEIITKKWLILCN